MHQNLRMRVDHASEGRKEVFDCLRNFGNAPFLLKIICTEIIGFPFESAVIKTASCNICTAKEELGAGFLPSDQCIDHSRVQNTCAASEGLAVLDYNGKERVFAHVLHQDLGESIVDSPNFWCRQAKVVKGFSVRDKMFKVFIRGGVRLQNRGLFAFGDAVILTARSCGTGEAPCGFSGKAFTFKGTENLGGNLRTFLYHSVSWN